MRSWPTLHGIAGETERQSNPPGSLNVLITWPVTVSAISIVSSSGAARQTLRRSASRPGI